ncbi:hypothetical protein FUSNEC_GEN_298_07415 [Fusobacterium necrophorum subsp. funduliforme]
MSEEIIIDKNYRKLKEGREEKILSECRLRIKYIQYT